MVNNDGCAGYYHHIIGSRTVTIAMIAIDLNDNNFQQNR